MSISVSNEPKLQKLLYSVVEAAYVVGVSSRSIAYLTANKQLNTIKLGKRVMYAHSELVKFCRSNHSHLTGSPE